MEAKLFFEEVAKMRAIQKEYYKTHSSLALQAAKKQEKLIDNEIERVREITGKREKQQSLEFNSPVTGESRR